MKNERFLELLGNIDDDLIERADNTEEKSNDKIILLFKRISVVASFCLFFGLILTAIIHISINYFGNQSTSPTHIPPTVSTIISSDKVTGKQEISIGEIQSNTMSDLSLHPTGFHIQTVVEATVVEVFPDIYYMPDSQMQYHVARLSIIDSIRAEGLPSEIYLRFPYYEANIFDGYDTFIFSLKQVGIKNYMMINENKKEASYFSNMFEVYRVNDLGYGSVIAFNDGKLDSSFFTKTTHFIENGFKIYSGTKYPVAYGDTIEVAKENIKRFAAEWEVGVFLSEADCNYKTETDVFLSKEAETVKDYVTPDGTNVFMQEIHVTEDRVIAVYTRIINGFATEERITLNGYSGENGNVKSTVAYSADDILSIPDVSEALEKLDLSKLTPPHTEITDYLELKYCQAKGYYRRSESQDKTYGIIRIVWYYHYSKYQGSILRDDCYYLYDNEGNGIVCEREELRNIIGEDSLILDFEYNSPIMIDV